MLTQTMWWLQNFQAKNIINLYQLKARCSDLYAIPIDFGDTKKTKNQKQNTKIEREIHTGPARSQKFN
jgi:hypothetical protein